MKNKIRLNEVQLHRVIKESVRKVMNEEKKLRGFRDWVLGLTSQLRDIRDEIDSPICQFGCAGEPDPYYSTTSKLGWGDKLLELISDMERRADELDADYDYSDIQGYNPEY